MKLKKLINYIVLFSHVLFNDMYDSRGNYNKSFVRSQSTYTYIKLYIYIKYEKRYVHFI